MGSFNPLVVILKENKLTGPNYIDWKRNLDIVLIAEEYKFLLTQDCPMQPHEGATDEETQAHRKWVRLMRWRGVTFWHPCRMFCNISISQCLVLMT